MSLIVTVNTSSTSAKISCSMYIGTNEIASFTGASGSSTVSLTESLIAQTLKVEQNGGAAASSQTTGVTESGTYTLSATYTIYHPKTGGTVYNYAIQGAFAAYLPLSASISHTTPVNIASISTSQANVSNGAPPYSTTWTLNGGANGTGASKSYGTTLSKVGGGSFYYAISVKDSNSTTVAVGPSTTHIRKLEASVSPTSTTTVNADVVSGASWTISTVNDDYTSWTTKINYGLSTALGSATTISGLSFTVTPNSVPSDATATTYYMQFEAIDTNNNVATTAIVAYKVVDSFTANLVVDGVGKGYTIPGVYYIALTQNADFITYATFKSTATTAINFTATWYSTTGTTNFAGAKSLANFPLTYSIFGFDNVSNLNKITYIKAKINDIQASGTVSTTSQVLGLAWSNPLSVNITPQIVNLTVNQSPSTSLIVTATGGSFNGGGSAYTYKWYVNNVLSGSSSTIFKLSTYSTSQVLSIFCQVQSQNTYEIATTPEVNIYVNGSVTASILGGNLNGMVGDTYQIVSSVKGGSPPYTYTWEVGNVGISSDSSVLTYSTTKAFSSTLQVTITDSQGASGNASIVINMYAYADPQLSFVTNYKDLIKVGATTEVQVSTSGNATYSYNFILNGASIKSGTSSTYTFSTTIAGSYSVYAIVTNTDTSNIMNSNTVTIEVYKDIGVQVTKQYSTTVVGNGINFFGQAVGGSPPYTYEWYVNTSQSTTGASTTGNSQSITLIEKSANTYYVYLHASDSAGNSITSGFSTTYFVAKPNVTISGSTDLKVGQKGNWSADIVGGSGVYDYTWYVDGLTKTSNGNFSSAAFSSSFSASGLYNIQLSVYDVNYRYQLQLSNSFNVAVGSTNVILSDVLTPLSLISETTSTTGSSPPPTSNYKFTVLVNGKNVYATNIASTTSLDLAGQLAFSVLKKYMYSTTNGTSIFMQVGSPVQFYVNGTEVFTGVVETIQMQSNMLYNVVAYDALYYLASIRAQTSIGSTTNGVDFGKMVGKLVEYGTVNYNITNTGFGGFSANIQSVQPFYYQLMQLATILGYAVYVDNSNTLHLVPYLGTTPLTITQNDRNYFSTTSNDTNYFYNSVSLIANNSDTLSTTIVSTTISGATNASKRLDLSWLTLNGATWSNGKTSDTESLAEMALGMFPNGYREVDIWYSLNNTNATTFLNLGNNFNITLDFADGRVWTDMFIETVSIDSTGLTLKCVNFPKDIWSQIQTVTGNAQ